MNPFSTHLPTLESLIEKYHVKSVFEFGCGFYSTGLFLKKCELVYACEMQSKEWYDKIKSQFADSPNLNIKYFEEKDDAGLSPKFLSLSYLKSLDTRFDLVFVDGHKDSRWICINEAQNYTNIIVTHDTEDRRNYHWDRISLPDCWTRHDSTSLCPWTTFWIKDAS